ncbi:MAG: M28 family peptidase [Ginsengibacter sp.]
MKYLLLFIFLYGHAVVAQKLKKSDRVIIENLNKDIGFLASDQLEGRGTGTPGEELAYKYIADKFKTIGLIPKGENDTYLQQFEVNDGKRVLPSTRLMINETSLDYGSDFFPFIFSAEKSLKTDASPALREKGRPWFWDIKDLAAENKNNPHFDLDNAIRSKAREFSDKGATAVIVYDTGGETEEPEFRPKEKAEVLNIPVLFLKNNAAKKYFSDPTSNLDIDINVALADSVRRGHNILGYIDNGAPETIILGGHYDHLGYGEDHNSLWTGARSIHNGADDNASGTAAVIELARLIKNSKLKNKNYLFISFSGEELGLFGSKYFTDHPTVDLGSVDYMINADMVGRLNDSTHALFIGGYGTSPSWGTILNPNTKIFQVKFDSSGIGPSDHTSFYLKNIPVLFFFTGTHKDYHKPSDDVDKINFLGELQVINYIYSIIERTNKMDKLVFSKTKEPKMDSPHFTVTLGIMPDYTFSGNGVKADAVIDGKIADRAGIKGGDVITKLGDYQTIDLNSYMEALGRFKKGDAARVSILRGTSPMTFDIVF